MGLKNYLGEYTIVKTIGQGAFSKVKLAIHRESGEKVAIKIIDKEMMRQMEEKHDKDAIERKRRKEAKERKVNLIAASRESGSFSPSPTSFTRIIESLRNQHIADAEPTETHVSESPPETLAFINGLQKEVQLMMRLCHPNIIKIYQVIESESECYIVMEHAKGELTDLLSSRLKLTEPEARDIFRQLVGAIDHCHEAEVVHRDLKLENLLLAENGEIRVSDFGLGRGYDHRAILSETFCGTPNYASAELVSGIPYIGAKSDIWSMGVILYLLVNGKPPFEGYSISSLYQSIKSVEYKKPEYLSAEILDLFQKIFVRDPNARIDMQGLREHPWVNLDFDQMPQKVAPKFKGGADLSSLIQSIYVEDDLKVYTFQTLVSTSAAVLSHGRSRRGSNSACLILDPAKIASISRRKSITTTAKPKSESSPAPSSRKKSIAEMLGAKIFSAPNEDEEITSIFSTLSHQKSVTVNPEIRIDPMIDQYFSSPVSEIPPNLQDIQDNFDDPQRESGDVLSAMRAQPISQTSSDSNAYQMSKSNSKVSNNSTMMGQHRSIGSAHSITSSISSYRRPSIVDNKVLMSSVSGSSQSFASSQSFDSNLMKRMSMVGPSSDIPEVSLELQLDDINEWHMIHRPPTEIRTMNMVFKSKPTTFSSTLDAASIFQDLHHALKKTVATFENNIKFKRNPNYYLFEIKYKNPESDVLSCEFEVEVCKVVLLNKFSLKCTRIAGNAIVFADIHFRLVDELKGMEK